MNSSTEMGPPTQTKGMLMTTTLGFALFTVVCAFAFRNFAKNPA